MRELLIETLESTGYPVYLQGTMAPNEPSPASFITYFTLPSDDASHYDNEPSGTVWRYEVILYSSDPRIIATAPREIRMLLKAEGFIPQGRGCDIPSDEPTHTGWAMEFDYLDMEE